MSQKNQEPKKNLRSYRRLLIHPRFQLPILITNLLVIFIFFIVAWVGTQNALSDLKPAAGLSAMEIEFFHKYLDYHASQVQRILWLALGAGLLFAGGFTLIITHRLAGPLVRLRIFFQSIIDDKNPTPKLEFRDGDFLREMEPLVNSAIKKIQATEKKAAS